MVVKLRYSLHVCDGLRHVVSLFLERETVLPENRRYGNREQVLLRACKELQTTRYFYLK